MTVQVIIPWRDTGCRHRQEAFGEVVKYYSAEHPEWFRTIGHLEAGQPWCKAEAVRQAWPTGDVLVIADADVIPVGDGLAEAVRRVADGEAGWAIPHYLVHRLTPEATNLYLTMGYPDPALLATVERPYRGVQGGGIVVLAREAYERVPLDPRFEGWGGEDQAWGVALHTLLGRAWRGSDRLVHLYHPPQERVSRKHGSPGNRGLFRRYCLARRDPDVMRQLLQEATA